MATYLGFPFTPKGHRHRGMGERLCIDILSPKAKGREAKDLRSKFKQSESNTGHKSMAKGQRDDSLP